MNSIATGTYVHYKSDDMRYEVYGVGRNTETDEDYVIYRPLYGHGDQPDFWIRPYDMFVGKVEVNGALIDRFRRVDEA